MMVASDVPVSSSEFTLEQLDDELLLYHPTKTLTVYMNETASLVWQLCDGKRTVGEIVRQLQQAYPEAADNMQSDVEQALAAFSEHGAITL